MLLIIPFWMIPTPAQAHAKEIPNLVELPLMEIQPVDNQPIQKADALSSTKNSLSNKPDKKRPVFDIGQSTTGRSEYSGRNYSKEEVKELIISYSEQYEINPNTPLCIAEKESGFNQFSKNKTSSASGVYQYLPSTWRRTDESKVGLSAFDADANIKAAIKYMAIHRSTKPWTVAKSCPSLTFTK